MVGVLIAQLANFRVVVVLPLPRRFSFLSLLFFSFANCSVNIIFTVKFVESILFCRSASVALNVWQPEIVRGRQKQMVEQCTVPIESRLASLKMEFQVCKQQIATYHKAYVCLIIFISYIIENSENEII